VVQITFHGSPSTSLGVEWELELVDAETGQLRSGATTILDRLAARRGAEHPKAKHEILESCIEVITGVCATVPEALADLAATVDEVRAEADQLGLELLCSGSHPLTDWATQETSPNPRYTQLVDQMQWMARQMQIFGVHVHVGVRSGEKVVPIVNALTNYMPHLLALSGSSPYWIGSDTGLASYRSKVFEGLPTAGPPYLLSGWTEFEDFMETLISAGTISSIREVWWDIRPHPDFGTVELRIFDGLPTLLEVGVAAALSQCLVEMLDHQLDRGYTLPVPHNWVVRENKWRAARYGLDAEIIVDERGRTQSLRRAVTELVEDLAPVAERLGCAEELAAAHVVLETGPSSVRQRRVAAAHGGDLRAVVRSLVDEMRAGRPEPAVAR
jgi:carboxylate-amine ligase